VAGALDYAWTTFGMIHCDIKPDNVMIDADGSVKITDLGLARMLSTVQGAAAHEENDILGTPAYMAPEQVLGLPGLDCRADIYALGATLYHMVTGTMLFQGGTENRIMEQQVSDTSPDVSALNPALSMPFCELVERMLAKDRDRRQPDWRTVLRDLASARAGHPLQGESLPPGVSTMQRSPARTEAIRRAALRAAMPSLAEIVEESEGRPSRWQRLGPVFALAGFVALLAGMAALVWQGVKRSRAPQNDEPRMVVRALPSAEDEAAALLRVARKWQVEHPDDWSGARSRYEAASSQSPGSEAAQEADQAIAAIDRERQARIDEVRRDLMTKASAALDADDPAAAVAVYERYAGPWAAETAAWRVERANILRPRVTAASLAPVPAEAPKPEPPPPPPPAAPANGSTDPATTPPGVDAGLWEAVARQIVARGVTEGRALLRERLAEKPALRGQADVTQAGELIDKAIQAELNVSRSFARQTGQEVTLRPARGAAISGTLVAVDDRGLVVEQRMGASGMVRRELAWSDLPWEERLSRLGPSSDPGAVLVKGLWARQSGARTQAAAAFDALPGPLGRALAQTLQPAATP
jgi:hypothetical protein